MRLLPSIPCPACGHSIRALRLGFANRLHRCPACKCTLLARPSIVGLVTWAGLLVSDGSFRPWWYALAAVFLYADTFLTRYYRVDETEAVEASAIDWLASWVPAAARPRPSSSEYRGR
jgi:hypothetical protein